MFLNHLCDKNENLDDLQKILAAEDHNKDVIKDKVREEVLEPCNQIKLSISKKKTLETDRLDNISKVKLQTLLSMYETDYKFQKDSIYYDVKAHPLNHFKTFYKLQELCESIVNFHILKSKKPLRFEGTIESDGIALTNINKQQSAIKNTYEVKHIENLTQKYLKQTVDKCVLVDPGRRELIHFRSLRKRNPPVVVKSAETAFSETESGSVSLENFVQYIKKRASVKKKIIYEYYGNEKIKSEEIFFPNSEFDFRHISKILQKLQPLLFRKLKFSAKLYLVKKLKSKFGSDTVFILGNWSSLNTKYQEPTRNKGLIKMLKKNGIAVYLINEFRTSSICPICENKLVKFKVITNPRPYKRQKRPNVICHGLLR
ncbi:hypothetical protein BDF21DRAFT_438117 [Thamnidium elegans]|nr:hypothetical protein BDF21DRAFT_438117 [Thamnidium elegans]